MALTCYVAADEFVPTKHASDGVLVGDVNSNGEINGKDRMIIARYAAGWEGYDEQIKSLAAADIDGDGTPATQKDAMILARYIAGWDGYEKYFEEEENSSVSTTYRALLIGEENFNPTCVRNRGDVVLMTNMLNSVTGALGGAWNITQDFDLTPTQVQQAIGTVFADADEDDISLFFIATHGDTKSEGSQAGALQTVDSSGTTGWIFFEDLASWLNAIPGKVIVIIESCGSGAALYEEGIDENSFNEAVINAFKNEEKKNTGLVANRANSQIVYDPQTGELRNDKFRVLTASRYQQESYGYESGDVETSYNLFTKWLTDGIGTSGAMPADTDSDGKVTLHEMFSYISSVGDNFAVKISGKTYYQNVQVYPVQSEFVLFRRGEPTSPQHRCIQDRMLTQKR